MKMAIKKPDGGVSITQFNPELIADKAQFKEAKLKALGAFVNTFLDPKKGKLIDQEFAKANNIKHFYEKDFENLENAKSDEITPTKDKYQDLNKEASDIQTSINRTNAAIEFLEKLSDEEKNKIDSLKDKLQSLKPSKSLNKETSDIKKFIDIANSQIGSFKAQIKSLGSKLPSLEKSYSPKVQELEKVKSELESIRLKHDKIKLDFISAKYAEHITAAEKLIPDDIEYVLGEKLEIPERAFDREAWSLEGNKVVVSQERQVAVIRGIRNNLLDKLDLNEMKEGLKPSGKVAEVKALKQKLRDFPKMIAEANLKTPEEVKNFTLNEFGKHFNSQMEVVSYE